MAEIGEECQHWRVSNGLGRFGDDAPAMERQQCDEGLAPEPTSRWFNATPNDIGVEILEEVADEWLAFAAGKTMLE